MLTRRKEGGNIHQRIPEDAVDEREGKLSFGDVFAEAFVALVFRGAEVGVVVANLKQQPQQVEQARKVTKADERERERGDKGEGVGKPETSHYREEQKKTRSIDPAAGLLGGRAEDLHEPDGQPKEATGFCKPTRVVWREKATIPRFHG